MIKPKRIFEYGKAHAAARKSLQNWLRAAQAAQWESLGDVRRIFNSADQVQVASKKAVLVFNIAGNAYRLIVAAHFNTGNLYVLRFMTHAEYDKDNWKKEL